MILTKLTLENYKQYRGVHELPINEDATVGVVGANGVGKTTVFEAIEWCLYNPRRIENRSIRPRGTGGEVRVVVQMATNDGGTIYEVERVLKRSGVQAAVYRLNEMGGGEPIVQGTRDVTDYISSRLIGLSHDAFVATFFTRQKELSFFGDMAPTQRRREVGKLLGFETIKQAQQLIADDRNRARADADSLKDQYEAMSGGRDLPAEIEAARAALGERQEALEASRATLEAAEAEGDRRETEHGAAQQLRERYQEHTAELRHLETRRANTTERREQVTGELERLDRRAEERVSLAAEAARLPALQADLERLERERDRHEARERLTREMQGCGQTIDGGLADARRLVTGARDATDDPGWAWSDLDDRRPLEAIDRLRAIAGAADLASVQARHNLYVSALGEQKRLEQEQGTLERYRRRFDQVREEVQALLTGDEAAALRGKAEAGQDAARAVIADARSRMTAASEQEQRARDLIARLERQHFEEACPTCGRPFSDDDAQFTIERMRETVERARQDTAEARAAITHAEADLKALQQELSRVQQIEERIIQGRASLASGSEHLQQQEEKVAGQERALHTVLAQLGLSASPSPEDTAEIEREVRRSRALHDTIQPLAMIRRSIADALATKERHETELATLTGIAWDPVEWREVSAAHTRANSAAGAVAQIDSDLARRPQLEHDLAAAVALIEQLDAEIASQTAARDAVGYDPAALEAAQAALATARSQAHEARQALATAERAASQADFDLKGLLRDQEQLADLGRRAEEKRALLQELDLMYREFSAFDKFVAQKLTPQLSDITSDIVAAMTDGAYDRVEFDEDYGIMVYDGDEEKFALETFSGGERDAISLAARLALSRMIGSQAANPPGFLVLDEVFGSLDAVRRERVLTLLGQHSHEFFRQMFIISHIDDVQQSPVFDTIWHVTQTEDGSSEVQAGVAEGELAD